MVKPLWADPVIFICIGIILIGLIGLFWAVGKFRRMKSDPTNGSRAAAPDPLLAAMGDASMEAMPEARPLSGVSSPVPEVSKEMAERLESMTQRLAEMQSVLTKQQSSHAAAASSTPTGGIGQGFSPETMDKLLKIVGNVIQQVDILQKNFTPPKEAPKTNVESAAPKV